MKVLVTGADGFVGRNLVVRLEESDAFTVERFVRASDPVELAAMVERCDRIVHLAGENRPADPAQFDEVNRGLTSTLAQAVIDGGAPRPTLFTSSIHAEGDSPYGRSKRRGEEALAAMAQVSGSPVAIYRFPNIFGKWSRPHYNSAVATFCHRAARGLPLEIHDPAARVTLAYIDDVVEEILAWLRTPHKAAAITFPEVAPCYSVTVGALAQHVADFAAMPQDLRVDGVGQGLVRALYATYVSFLPNEKVAYPLVVHADPRGRFVEMLRSADSGQVSYFTAGPGITRGGHYHHTKSEKFLVVKGRAKFRFRHILTGEAFELETSDDVPRVVDTIPGWSHDITNTGPEEMIVMLWANEIFDRDRPDTIAQAL